MESAKVSCEEKMKKALAALKDEFNGVRTGRASPSLLDKIRVDYYGQKTPLAQVATISVPEARLIVIQPWDRALIGEIEKAIQKSELSLNPSNDGKVIRIAIPPLTEERRKELAKMAKAMAEQSRVSIRNVRRDGLEELKKLLAAGGHAEDAIKKEEDELQKLTDSYIAQVGKALEEKDKEIMEV
jgi:ribosome recycling factor